MSLALYSVISSPSSSASLILFFNSSNQSEAGPLTRFIRDSTFLIALSSISFFIASSSSSSFLGSSKKLLI